MAKRGQDRGARQGRQSLHNNNQQAQQAESAAQQAELQDKEQQRQFDYYKVDEDNRAKRDVAYINNQGTLANTLASQTPETNSEAIAKGNAALDDLYSKREENNLRYADIQQKREKSINDYKIAEVNRNQYSK